MKNMKKLVALFAATVMAMSVSVSAFAATVETTVAPDNADIADGAFNLVFAAPEGGEADVDQLTMIAYLVPAETTMETWVAYDGNQEIVAINQVGGDVGFGRVPVDVAKLTEGKSIAVAIGGTDVGTTAKYLVTYTTAPQVVSYAVEYQLDGGTAEGNPAETNSEETIADFFAKVTAEPEKDGYEFLHWSKVENGDAIDTESDELMSTLLDAGSTTTVTLYAVYETASEPIIVVIGDVDGDEDADNDDAVAIQLKLIGGAQKITGAPYAIGELVADGICYGDVDGDGDADNDDAVAMQLKLIGGAQKITGAPYAIGERVEIK